MPCGATPAPASVSGGAKKSKARKPAKKSGAKKAKKSGAKKVKK